MVTTKPKTYLNKKLQKNSLLSEEPSAFYKMQNLNFTQTLIFLNLKLFFFKNSFYEAFFFKNSLCIQCKDLIKKTTKKVVNTI